MVRPIGNRRVVPQNTPNSPSQPKADNATKIAGQSLAGIQEGVTSRTIKGSKGYPQLPNNLGEQLSGYISFVNSNSKRPKM